jgi:D-alanine-D-alanine ligase
MKTVALMFGGQSPEHEISIISGKAIFKHIDKKKFNIALIAVTKTGDFFTGEGCFDLLEKGDTNNVRKFSLQELKKFDVVFPIFHGPFGEDGTIQGLLQFIEVPYVGCGIEASAINMHKGLMRDFFTTYGLHQPEYIYFSNSNIDEAVSYAFDTFNFPLFVKPCKGGSSLGISKVEQKKQLKNAIEHAFKFDNEVIIEESFPATEEIEVAVLGSAENHIVSIPGKLIPADSFYTYEDKYKNNKTYFEIPCNSINHETVAKIQEVASKAFDITKCHGLARIDFLYNSENDNFVINEINTMPGFTEISMYPKLMNAEGISFTELITKLIVLATER